MSTAPARACTGLCRNRCPRAEPHPGDPGPGGVRGYDEVPALEGRVSARAFGPAGRGRGVRGQAGQGVGGSYSNHYRRGLIKLIQTLKFRSTNEHQPVVQALELIKKYATSTAQLCLLGERDLDVGMPVDGERLPRLVLERTHQTTGAPASANARAIPRPRPRLAPTTTVVLPDKPLIVLFLCVFMVSLAVVLVVAAPPEAVLVATEWRAVEPLVH